MATLFGRDYKIFSKHINNALREELADVLVYCRNMLDKLELDEDEIVNEKMSRNEAKYPVEKAKGSAKKYNEI